MKWVYLGHDSIHHNLGGEGYANSMPQELPLRDMLWGNSQLVSPPNFHTSLNRVGADKDLVFIVPNQTYENKAIYNTTFKTISQWVDHQPTIISEIEAIAGHLIHQHHGDGVYRINNICQHAIQVHDLEIVRNQHFHLNSQEFTWNTPTLIKAVFENREEQFFSQQYVEDQIALINKIWREDFDSLDPKHYQYRVDYASKVTYRELKNLAERIAKEYKSILDQLAPPKSYVKEYYCGTISAWNDFMDLIGKPRLSPLQQINWQTVINASFPYTQYYPVLDEDVQMCLYGVEEQWIKVLNQGQQYFPGYSTAQPAAPGIKNIRIPLPSGSNQQLCLQFKSGNHQYDGILDLSKPNGLASAKIKTNGAYQWLDADLSVELDGCRNIVLSIFQDSKLLHTAAISKLKKHE